jgi:hypothetical protein
MAGRQAGRQAGRHKERPLSGGLGANGRHEKALGGGLGRCGVVWCGAAISERSPRGFRASLDGLGGLGSWPPLRQAATALLT